MNETAVRSSRETKTYQVKHLGRGRYAEPAITIATASGATTWQLANVGTVEIMCPFITVLTYES